MLLVVAQLNDQSLVLIQKTSGLNSQVVALGTLIIIWWLNKATQKFDLYRHLLDCNIGQSGPYDFKSENGRVLLFVTSVLPDDGPTKSCHTLSKAHSKTTQIMFIY